MFDAKLRTLIDPGLNSLARMLNKTGISANMITLFGAAIALAAGAAIATQHYGLGLIFVTINRLLDGLDGPVARLNKPSEFGGYLDSLADFFFYVSVPVAFGISENSNLLPALLLVASFTLTAVSFLAFAAIAARTDSADGPHGAKAFIYSTGLMEGTETIVFFILMCVLPAHFALLAYIFAALCIITVIQRVLMASRAFI
jgi:phosphatidylglycerophosphate synthase